MRLKEEAIITKCIEDRIAGRVPVCCGCGCGCSCGCGCDGCGCGCCWSGCGYNTVTWRSYAVLITEWKLWWGSCLAWCTAFLPLTTPTQETGRFSSNYDRRRQPERARRCRAHRGHLPCCPSKRTSRIGPALYSYMALSRCGVSGVDDDRCDCGGGNGVMVMMWRWWWSSRDGDGGGMAMVVLWCDDGYVTVMMVGCWWWELVNGL